MSVVQADASEQLRQTGFSHLYPHPVLIKLTRSCPLEPPPIPPVIPAWKLIRPRKKKVMPTDEAVRKYPGVRVSECPGVRVSGRPGVRVSECPGSRVSEQPGVRVSGCPGVRVSGCPGVRESESPSIRVAEYPSSQVAECLSSR